MISDVNIIDLIPQKAPFVMIGKLISSGEKTTRTSFRITADNIFVEDGKFREPGLLENIAQTAAVRVGYLSSLANEPVRLGYIGAVKNFEVLMLPEVNDEIETEISIENKVFDITLISGRITCKNQPVAHCEMKIFINPL